MHRQRRLLAALRKSVTCSRGCRGWCSFHALFEWLSWSLEALARGRHPDQRHDGKPWADNDQAREQNAGEPLPARACVVWLKGDWAEFANTWGLPSWADAPHPARCAPALLWRGQGGH